MDFEQNNITQPQSQQGFTGPAASGVEKPKKRIGWKIFWGVFVGLSVLANILLFMMLIGVLMVFAAGQRSIIAEDVIQAGPRNTKIAVINIEGIIDTEQAEGIYHQLKTAREDRRVKGLILRGNSPGGTISASDQIYNEIRKYRLLPSRRLTLQN